MQSLKPILLLGTGVLAALAVTAILEMDFSVQPDTSTFTGLIAMDGEWGDGFFGCGRASVATFTIEGESDIYQRYGLLKARLGEPLYVEIEGRLVERPADAEVLPWVDPSTPNLEIYGYRNMQRNRPVYCEDGTRVLSPAWLGRE